MDKEKVIKGLEDIQKHLDTGCSFTICWKSELIRDALALLKKQEAIIQCKDCKYHDEEDGKNFCDCGNRPDDWFCADGEMKESRSGKADDTIPRFDDSIGRMPEL